MGPTKSVIFNLQTRRKSPRGLPYKIPAFFYSSVRNESTQKRDDFGGFFSSISSEAKKAKPLSGNCNFQRFPCRKSPLKKIQIGFIPNSIRFPCKDMILIRVLTLFLLISFGVCNEGFNPHLLPRPLILEYPENGGAQLGKFNEEVQLQCTSWRFAAETNNLSPWKTIPEECAEYVKDYVMGRGYKVDLERVSNEAGVYAKSVQLSEDGKDAWVFDVDETLLSNLPYYAEHKFGLEIFDQLEFDKWVEKGVAPAIEASLRLYEKILDLGFKVFLLTGRSEKHRSVTVENLSKAGFQNWDKLILRASEDHGKLATIFKSEKRGEMVSDGYRILGNSGDQWSDLLGSFTSVRSFKLPNPMYYIP